MQNMPFVALIPHGQSVRLVSNQAKSSGLDWSGTVAAGKGMLCCLIDNVVYHSHLA